MRKIILSIAFALCSMAYAQAQLSGGLKAGLNLSNISNLDMEEDIDMKSKIGYHFGAYLNAKLAEKISIQPEVLFSTQGSKASDSEEDSGYSYEYDIKANVNYLNIPVLVTFHVNEMFNLYVGPQAGFLLSAELKSEATEEGPDGKESYESSMDMKEYMKSTDFGVVFGAGVNLPAGLNASLRYNLGLSDIAEENEGDAIKNGVLQLSVGYRLFGN
ncbi:porin family protein [Rapidithrix thailandica]|uniref:Porin family protein n=1 Tax=Rapidithrix thailandica TaxID=413964 RepID=A0AAW9SG45_9BACT